MLLTENRPESSRLVRAGKFSEYLMYAIGEIILVVIGILIALQVNNWNGNKKELARSHKILQNITEEIKQDSIYFNNVYNAENDIFLNSAQLFFHEHIKGQMSVAYDSVVGMAFRLACFTPVIKSSKNAYNELMSSGLLAQIKSEDLELNLKEYYWANRIS